MPTVIDALVVELSLDPSNFNDGQKRAADSLGKLQTAAQQSAGRIQESGAGVVSFFRILENPIGSLRRHFETLAVSTQRPRRELADLAAQGRRTGAGIEAGALAGAAGLRVMGVAGLGALAVLTLLNKAQNAASEAAVKTFGSGLGAAAAGVPIQEFTAMSQALLHKGNVPEEVTQGWMARLRTAQVQAAAGHPEEAIALNTAFAQAGIQANALSDRPEQVMAAIAKRFHEVSADVAIGLGDLIGQSAVLAKALHDLGDKELEAQVAAERQRAATEADSAASDELIKTKNNLRIATDNLGRAMLLLLGGPMAKFIDWVAFMAGNLANVAKGKPWEALPEESQEKGPGATAPIPPREGAPAAPGRGSNAAPVPAGERVNRAMTFFEGKGLTHEQAAGVVARLNAESGLNPNSVNPTSGATGIAQWLGGRKVRMTAAGAGGDFDKQLDLVWREFQTTEAPAFARIKSARTAAEAARAMEGYERVGNPSFTEGAARSATGLALKPMVPSLVSPAEAAPPRPDDAVSTPPRRVSPWPPRTGGETAVPPQLGGTATLSPTDAALAEILERRRRANNGDISKPAPDSAPWPSDDKSWSQKVGDQLSLIQSSKAGDNTTTTHSTTNADTNVGDIHVHVPAGSDGYVIGGAINDTIQRRGSMATQANTGLQ